MNRPRLVLLTAGALAALGLVAWISAPRWTGMSAVLAARREAEARGVTRQAVLAALPETRSTRSARELDRLAARAESWLWIRPGTRRSFGMEAALRWTTGELDRAAEAISAPTPRVVAELDRLAPALRAVADALPGREAARWPARLGAVEEPEPNLMGHLQLQRLLLAESLLATERGDSAAASSWLDAAWRANALLAPRSEVVSQFVRIAGARGCASATCKVASPSALAESRLEAQSFRDGLASAQAGEAVLLLEAAESGNLPWWGLEEPSRLELFLAIPSERRSAAVRALGCVEASVLARDPRRCGRATHPLPRALPTRAFESASNATADDSGAETLRRLDALVLHFELARRVLELKRLRAADPVGEWPIDLPGGERAACDGVRFAWTRPGPGIVRLEAESPEGAWWLPHAPNAPGPVIAWESGR